MNIAFVEIRNFRRLKSCRVDLGAKTTVFVGANNSEKTSAMFAFVKFLKKASTCYRRLYFVELGSYYSLRRAVCWWSKTSHAEHWWLEDNIEHGKELFEALENTEFGCLIKQVENLPIEDRFNYLVNLIVKRI